MKIIQEFKEFAMKGNMIDLAVGIILGAAFGAVVTSLVENILMPPIGWAIGGVDFSDLSISLSSASPEARAALEAEIAAIKAGEAVGDLKAKEAALVVAKEGVLIKYGMFLNAVIRFLIQAAAVFFVIKVMNNLKKKDPVVPETAKLTADQELLTEIRDLLAARNSA